MSFDAKKFPMIDMSHPPMCKGCDTELRRLDLPLSGPRWVCNESECDGDFETDAQLDNRLQSEAESAFERQQERGGFLSPDACQRTYKR